MRKILSVVTCSLLAACACDENQWEEVDVIAVEETPYVEETTVVAEPAPVVVQQEAIYVPTPVYDQPYAEVQPQPCCQSQPCYQPCGYMPMPMPKPKVTTTKKIITTTTTIQEPCGKPVCEPVVTTHEEIIPAEVSYAEPVNVAPAPVPVPAPVVVERSQNIEKTQTANNDFVEVTVSKNPYRSEVVGMRSSTAKVDASSIAKYSPEVYNVVAGRATNRMLQDTSAIYDNGNTKTVYLKDTQLLSSDLPYGSHRLKGAVKEIISGSKTYDVVNSAQNADFVIESSADWYVSPDNTVPALQYKMSMFDKHGKKVNEWVEIIRQVQE